MLQAPIDGGRFPLDERGSCFPQVRQFGPQILDQGRPRAPPPAKCADILMECGRLSQPTAVLNSSRAALSSTVAADA